MSDVKISVIIPVYNSENSMEDCLKSIFNQTLKDIEIICVNDGSTDNSLSVLEEYAKKDNRIKIFTKENSGSGASRNLGISKAKGEYIAFLDSDDYIVDENAYYTMYNEAKKFDVEMVSAGIQFVDKGNISYEYKWFKPITELKLKKPEEYGIPWYFYKNIFKRDFLINNNIRFPNLLRGQDPVFFSEILTKINEFLEVPILHYSYLTPNENKVNNPIKYNAYFLHFYEVFKILMSNKQLKPMVIEFTKILTEMEGRDIHVTNKNELLSLIGIMDKIKLLYVDYGEEFLIKEVSDSFDTLLSRINIENIEIIIKDYEYLNDIYSEGVIIKESLKKPKISFVLPVYNVENYVSECLDSVINQTLQDIEIICINDGSTDKSLDILNSYANKDNRISIFSFTNKGLGPARNRGIDRAHGEYIAFVDTDDWLELDFAEKIYKTATKNYVDIVLFNAVAEYDNYKQERIYFKEGTIEDSENFVFDFNWNLNIVMQNYFTAWSKLHRTEFLRDNNIRFPASLFEDMEFQVESFIKAKKMAYNPNIFYHYRKENPSSIMNSLKDDECYCIFGIVNRIENHLNNNNVYNTFSSHFIKYKINQFREKFESTHVVFKSKFFNDIRSEFIKMDLSEDLVNKFPQNVKMFYKNVVDAEEYWMYTKLKCDDYKCSIENNVNLSLNSNLFINPFRGQRKFISNDNEDITNFIINSIQNDLLNNNLMNLKAYEEIINQNLFDYEYYGDKFNYNDSIDSLLHYIYINQYKINNPTPFLDCEFYSKFYNLTSNINPLVFYSLIGRFEGKDNLNENIKINSINRRHLNKEIKKLDSLCVNNKEMPELIVSLTSFPDRMNNIVYTLYSLLNQSVKPDKIILWLANEQFPNKEDDVPFEVLNLKKFGLTIKWCDDLKSYKKLIPCLREFPNSIIVTADDDVFYSKDWLKILFEEHKKHPKDIIAHRCRKIQINSNKNIGLYNTWYLLYDENERSFLNLFTGVGGVLYPPNALHPDVLNESLFKHLCPRGDDLWFWGMAVRNGTKIRVPNKCVPYLNFVNGIDELKFNNHVSLWSLNQNGGNDSQFRNLINHFPEIKNKLLEERME